MLGTRFTDFIPDDFNKANFENLLNIFLQILNIMAGDVGETLRVMNDLDRDYNITADDYGMGDFINDLKQKGYLTDENDINSIKITAKTERAIRKRSLEQIFDKLKKGGSGNHTSFFSGAGDEINSDKRKFNFGDSFDQIDNTSSFINAQINHGLENFNITEEDLVIEEKEYKTITSTVLMIDISHSMILYGEDRITPAKTVAMALAELISTKYPKDTLDLIVFGNDAWPIEIRDLPYLEVGPYHTNTCEGLELAMDILRRRKTKNKQIFMITDGKPTCLKEGAKYYKNSYGLDRKIVNKTLDKAAICRKLGITITTFMIARDPYLQSFVRDFTKVNQGRAYYSSLNNLGEFLFEDFVKNRRRTVR